MDLMEALTSIVKIAQASDNIPLRDAVLSLQQFCTEVVIENRNLKDQIRQLTDMRKIREGRFEHDAYWLSDRNDPQSGPICSACADTLDRVVRMHRSNDAYAQCPKCKAVVCYAPKNSPDIHSQPPTEEDYY